MQMAGRRQVPAFGEWNNHCYHYQYQYGEPPAAKLYALEPEACSDVWFRYSPPARKPMPKKTRKPEGGKESLRARDSSDAAGGLARATKGAFASRVVRPVDEDLYQVPPPEFVGSHRPRRKRRSLLMGCLGLGSCVV